MVLSKITIKENMLIHKSVGKEGKNMSVVKRRE